MPLLLLSVGEKESKAHVGNECDLPQETSPYNHIIEKQSSVLHFPVIRSALTSMTFPQQHAYSLILA